MVEELRGKFGCSYESGRAASAPQLRAAQGTSKAELLGSLGGNRQIKSHGRMLPAAGPNIPRVADIFFCRRGHPPTLPRPCRRVPSSNSIQQPGGCRFLRRQIQGIVICQRSRGGNVARSTGVAEHMLMFESDAPPSRQEKRLAHRHRAHTARTSRAHVRPETPYSHAGGRSARLPNCRNQPDTPTPPRSASSLRQ